MSKSAFLKKNVLTNEIEVVILFSFNQEDLNIVRSIPGRKFVIPAKSTKGKKYWTAPLTHTTIKILSQNGWGFHEQMKQYLNKVYSNAEKRIEKNEQLVHNLPKELYPFQKQGVERLLALNGRALLADEMGLGKTIQSLMWLKLNPEKVPAIIICPASLKYNWEIECKKWLKTDSISVLSGTTPRNFKSDIVIINYDIVHHWLWHFKTLPYQTIILDECHYIKNDKAKRTKAIKTLTKGVKHVIAISGTAIVNKPIEVYNVINILNPRLFPSRWNFAHKYCNAKHTGFGWDFNGASNIEELHNILKNNLMIRRKKQDVLKDLPEKIYTQIPLEIDNRKKYTEMEQDFIDYIEKQMGEELSKTEKQLQKELGYVNVALNIEDIIKKKVESISKAEMLVKVGFLQRKATKGILKIVKEWIYDFLENQDKLVIFAVHSEFINNLLEEFKDIAVKIDGSTPINKRQEIVNEFQTNKKIKLFIGNIKAAGVGLTLTASSNVAFLEYPWAPGDLVQAEDRCHRIGQKNSVNIFHFVAKNTIIEDILEILRKKSKVVNALLDGRIVEENEDTFIEFLKTYHAKN